jgi:hypothetical protein
MRYRHILLAESRMKELATVMSDLRDLPVATAEIDQQTQEVLLRFVLDGQSGTVRMRIRLAGSAELTAKSFRSKIFACAISQMSGRKPENIEEAIRAVSGEVRNRSIRILTNTENWVVAGMRYGEFRF